jgi:hypothetical protein
VRLCCDDERHWLRAAPARLRHLFPRLLSQSEYNQRLKAAAPLMETALRWLADQTPGSAEMLRLMDGTPVPCGQSVVTAKRSGLAGHARKDEKRSRCFPNWLRQRVEAIIWTIKSQLGLERHGGCAPAGLWARVVQRPAHTFRSTI